MCSTDRRWGEGGSVRLQLVYAGINAPQSSVLEHSFASGFVFASHDDVLHFTTPAVPVRAAPGSHLSQAVASSRIHLPKQWVVVSNQANLRWFLCQWCYQGEARVAQAGGGSECSFGIRFYWHQRTTIHGFGAWLWIRLLVRVTTRRVASHCARHPRFAFCNSTFCGTTDWQTLDPLA